MRYELTDHEWTAIKPMLPNKLRGVPRVNDRRVLNGIFWVLRSGAHWRDLPEPWSLHHLLQSLRSLIRHEIPALVIAHELARRLVLELEELFGIAARRHVQEAGEIVF
jgi:transposase